MAVHVDNNEPIYECIVQEEDYTSDCIIVVNSNEPTKIPEMRGTVMKRDGEAWKDRYLMLKPHIWALFYYEALSKCQGKPLGVYSLLGATVSEIKENQDGGYSFSLSLRSKHSVCMKVPDINEARKWKDNISMTITQPIIVPSEGEMRGECCIKGVLSPKRFLVLDYSSYFMWSYKKNDEMKPQETIQLKGAQIVMKKSYGTHFDIVISSKTDAKQEYQFKTAEEWAKWGTALEVLSRGPNEERLM